MNLTTLFDSISHKQKQRLNARVANYRSLVKQVADGKDPDADEVDRVLTDNDKTVDDLRTAVELLLKRRELRRALDQKPKLAKERKQIEQQLEKANQQLELAETRHTEITDPLYVRLEEIRLAKTEADRALQELERTCDDEDLIAGLEAVSEQLKTLHTHRARCEKESRELRSSAESDRQETRFVTQTRAEDLRERADRRDARAQEMETELPGLRKQISKAEAREKAIREQMLAP